MLRGAVVAFAFAGAVVAAAPAIAGDMGGEEARRWVSGKLFTYTCFEGTRGAGRVFADGSVIGTIQFQGAGPVRRAFLPAGTLHVKDDRVCASLKGMPFSPCFNLSRDDNSGFRGAISGLGFAYCDFKRNNARPAIADNSEPKQDVAQESGEQRVQPRRHARRAPVSLRPSLAEAQN